MSGGGVDAELDAMLNDLGDMEIGKPVLPAHWGETKPVSEFHGKRHDEREVKQLLNTLDKNDGGILRVRAPELPPVEKSTAGACHSCRAQIYDAQYARTAEGDVFHSQCFSCSQCKRTISDGLCSKKNGQIICSKCSTSVCKRCRQDISATDRFVSPEDDVFFHSPGCVTCGKCSGKLNVQEAFFIRGDLLCKNCA